jgi:hypothetical protein
MQRMLGHASLDTTAIYVARAVRVSGLAHTNKSRSMKSMSCSLLEVQTACAAFLDPKLHTTMAGFHHAQRSRRTWCIDVGIGHSGDDRLEQPINKVEELLPRGRLSSAGVVAPELSRRYRPQTCLAAELSRQLLTAR